MRIDSFEPFMLIRRSVLFCRPTHARLLRFWPSGLQVSETCLWSESRDRVTLPVDRMNAFYRPPADTYDCIWIQWVVGHLPDDECINFLKRSVLRALSCAAHRTCVLVLVCMCTCQVQDWATEGGVYLFERKQHQVSTTRVCRRVCSLLLCRTCVCAEGGSCLTRRMAL